MALPATDITGANWNAEFETLRQQLENMLESDRLVSASQDLPLQILPFGFRSLTTSSTARDAEQMFTPQMDCYVSAITAGVHAATGATATITVEPVSTVEELLGPSSALPTLAITVTTANNLGREDGVADLEGTRPVLLQRNKQYKIKVVVSANVAWVGGAINLSSYGRRV